jgi:hypothetical protein
MWEKHLPWRRWSTSEDCPRPAATLRKSSIDRKWKSELRRKAESEAGNQGDHGQKTFTLTGIKKSNEAGAPEENKTETKTDGKTEGSGMKVIIAVG